MHRPRVSPPLHALLLLLVAACSPTMGEPRHLDLPTVVVRADEGTQPADVAAAIAEANPRIALVAGPADPAWFDELSATSGLGSMSGPGLAGPDLGLAFLGPQVVGDTTIEITYDGGSFVLHDALYDLGQRRWLDLLAFRVESAEEARPLVLSLARYVATDVYPGAAIVMAVAVPSAAVGDSVARLLTPMYQGAVHCGAPPDALSGSGVRLFYGPEARIYCRATRLTGAAGYDRVTAELVVGRRR